MKKINYRQIRQSIRQNQIVGLGPTEPIIYAETLKKLAKGQNLTFINIICPGYKKRREVGIEEFDFVELSDNVLECPNVLLMLEKMENFFKNIDRKLQKRIETNTILADLAILNYRKLVKRQNVKEVMDRFFLSIRHSNLMDLKTAKLLKMSELSSEFKKIPLGGIRPRLAKLLSAKAEIDIKSKAAEYVGSLVFERVNKLMSKGKSVDKRRLVMRAQKEVERFVAEYGLAGLAIKKMYKNPVVFFTEPSGYMRGYFYNSFLKGKNRLPVLYLC